MSDTTYKKVISGLVDDGVLQGEWGKGVFVKSRFSNTSFKNINLIVPGNSETLGHPAFSEVIQGVMHQTVKIHYHLVFTFLDPVSRKKERIAEKISSIDSSGIIIPFILKLDEAALLPLVGKGISSFYNQEISKD